MMLLLVVRRFCIYSLARARCIDVNLFDIVLVVIILALLASIGRRSFSLVSMAAGVGGSRQGRGGGLQLLLMHLCPSALQKLINIVLLLLQFAELACEGGGGGVCRFCCDGCYGCASGCTVRDLIDRSGIQRLGSSSFGIM